MLTSCDMREVASYLHSYDGFPTRDIAGRERRLLLAADLEHTAEASQGHSTVETFHVALVLDNDAALYAQRREMVRDAEAAATNATGELLPAVAVTHLAGALRSWCEQLCGLEAPLFAEPHGEEVHLPELAREMVGVALDGVDWRGLARGYLAEHDS